ncbi:hypothetical protein DYI24_04765, partial [Rhodopseudomonas sp. BR0C11]|nr:hypothetical protein [Rhodopseudomonas sp. BR0C11]
MVFLHWTERSSPLAIDTPMEVTIIAAGEAAIDIPEAVAAPAPAERSQPEPPESSPAANEPAHANDQPPSPEPSPEVVETLKSPIRVETSAKPNRPQLSRSDRRHSKSDNKPPAAPGRPRSR